MCWMEEDYMSKETDTKDQAYDPDVLGELVIADEVVANIAGIAAKETDGVFELASSGAGTIMDMVGVRSSSRGIRVEVIENIVSVDMALIMNYGYNIPSTCKKVQEKVISSIENMTGLIVSDVNIRIAGIELEKQD